MTVDIDKLTGKVRKFADACVSTQTIAQLEDALKGSPDRYVLLYWRLAARDYYTAIAAAIKTLKEGKTDH